MHSAIITWIFQICNIFTAYPFSVLHAVLNMWGFSLLSNVLKHFTFLWNMTTHPKLSIQNNQRIPDMTCTFQCNHDDALDINTFWKYLEKTKSSNFFVFYMIYNHGQKKFTFLCEDKYGSNWSKWMCDISKLIRRNWIFRIWNHF